MWKGGRSVASNGYILIRVGKNHHLADVRGYAYEHRIVGEGKLGRRLRPGEVVHRINGVKSDNRPSNLEVMPSHAHHHLAHRRLVSRLLKHPDEPNNSVCCACGCGQTFLKYDPVGRPRKYLPLHKQRTLRGPNKRKEAI